MSDKKNDAPAPSKQENEEEKQQQAAAAKDNEDSGSDAGGEVHQFWDTQPVIHTTGDGVHGGVAGGNSDGMDVTEGPIEVRTVAEVQPEPHKIASTFEWWTPDISNDQHLQQIHELLRDNYVEDDGATFRFNYSIPFLRWALTPPGYIHDWHIGVRRRTDGKLLAFISGIPYTTRMGHTPEAGEPKRICEINFLCVHKGLRAKRLAPILIKEVTRRVNLLGIWQAIYTAGRRIPTPFAKATYYHRSIDPEKLVAINFSRVPHTYQKFSNPMMMLKRHYQLPAKAATAAKSQGGLRPMTPADVPAVTVLLNASLVKYAVAAIFTEDEVAHWLLPRKDVIYSYVVEGPAAAAAVASSSTGTSSSTSATTAAKDAPPAATAITDFFSFYNLPSTVIGNSKYDNLRAAYIFYYAHTHTDLKVLMNDLLIKARDEKFDVVNVVDILENRQYIEDLKFIIGDGSLHYYFYNWRIRTCESTDVGFVML